MNIVTGCSGIDAIAYAAELLDIDIIGQIEIDPFCNQILELRYPGVKRLNDVFDVKGDEFGTVDIFSFGDPCQPHSVAGRQKGTADVRYIWPELYRIIKTMRPTWVINENVTGSVSNGVVLSKINDLENEGYRARAFIIPACSVGAPHQRYRVFIVAYSERDGFASTEGSRSVDEAVQQEQTGQDNAIDIEGADSIRETLGNTERSGLSGKSRGRSEQKSEDGYIEPEKDVADTESAELNRTFQPRRGEPGSADDCSLVNAGRSGCEEYNPSGIATNQGHAAGGYVETGDDRTTQPGVGGNVDGLPGGLYGSERHEDDQGVFEIFETIFTAVLEQINWPAGYGAEQHGYEPPRVISGMKNRTNRLKTLGNAIVPWQVFPFLLAIKLIGGTGT